MLAAHLVVFQLKNSPNELRMLPFKDDNAELEVTTVTNTAHLLHGAAE